MLIHTLGIISDVFVTQYLKIRIKKSFRSLINFKVKIPCPEYGKCLINWLLKLLKLTLKLAQVQQKCNVQIHMYTYAMFVCVCMCLA